MAQYRDILGVDLTKGRVRLVHVRRQVGRIQFKTRLEETLPRDRDQAAAVLRELTEKHGLRKIPAVVALGGESVVFRSIPLHSTDPRSVRQVATMEAEHFDDLSGHETVYDHQLLDTPVHGRQILLAITRTEAAMDAVDIPTEGGLKVLDVVPEPVAWFNAISENLPQDGAPSLLLRVSREETELLVGNRKHLMFLRRLPLGADALTAPLDSREAVHQEWAEEIKNCLDLYQGQLPGEARQPAHAYLVGLPDPEPGLVGRLINHLPFPVSRLHEKIDNPWVPPEAEPYAAAAGLALEGVGKAPVRLSLLPHDLKQSMSLRLQLKFWILCGLVTLLTATLITVSEFNRRTLLRRELDTRQFRLNSLQQSAVLLAEYRLANQRLTRKIESLRAPIHNGRALLDLFHAVSEAKHPDDWITRMADTDSYISESNDPPVDTASLLDETQAFAEPVRKVILEGYTPWEDFSTVQAIIESIREHPAVEEADLLGDDELRIDEDEAHEWAQLGCRLFAIEVTLVAP